MGISHHHAADCDCDTKCHATRPYHHTSGTCQGPVAAVPVPHTAPLHLLAAHNATPANAFHGMTSNQQRQSRRPMLGNIHKHLRLHWPNEQTRDMLHMRWEEASTAKVASGTQGSHASKHCRNLCAKSKPHLAARIYSRAGAYTRVPHQTGTSCALTKNLQQ
jgi:hypothetical protein